MAAQTVLGILAIAVAGLLYVTPTLVGAHRDVVGLPRIVQLNVLLGWTVLLWGYCLIAAVRLPRRSIAPDRRWAAGNAPALSLGPVQSDRLPDWLRELPREERTWQALPRDTAPLPIDDHPESR